MNLVDKLLLILLIVLLPLGLLVSYRFYKDGGSWWGPKISEEKVDQLIEQLEKQQAPNNSGVGGEIEITSIGVATEEAKLSITGKVPNAQALVMMTVAVMPSGAAELNPENKDRTTGRNLETVAVGPELNNTFRWEYVIKQRDAMVVEIRFEQGNLNKTIRYDLKAKRQIF